MRLLIAATLAASLIGCASVAKTQRVTDKAGNVQEFSGHYDATSGDIQIKLNGEKIMSDSVGFFNKRAEMTTTKDGQRISASCWRGILDSPITPRVRCEIFINGEIATTLQF